MYRIAVLVPCYNEAVTISAVIRAFSQALPAARIYICDNNSTDGTADIAQRMGAQVCRQPLQGKGHALRRMFADVDADVYVIVDGDATYDAAAAPAMVARLLDERLDMVVGARCQGPPEAFRPGHRMGNRLFTGIVGWIFGHAFTDMLSGYRILSRRFIKSYPALGSGFEVEAELTIHALELSMPVAEHPTSYRHRVDGSHSKLRTWADGWRILWFIVRLTKSGKPLAFFSSVAGCCMACAVLLAGPLLDTYIRTGLVPRLPTALLCVALAGLAALCMCCGLVLSTVTMGRREQKHLAYLAHPAPEADRG